MKIAFILDPLETLRLPWDTSSVLLAECQRREFEIYTATPEDLSWKPQGVTAKLAPTRLDSVQGYRRLSPAREMPLSRLDGVWMRKDPPVNLAYLTCCQLLALASRNTAVINNPRLLQTKNEKLYALEFPQAVPPSLVSHSASELGKFLQVQGGKMVIKPLHSRGGRGVELLRKTDKKWRQKISRLTSNGKKIILAQRFLPQAVSEGSKRVLFVDGKMLPPFLRLPTRGMLRGKAIRGEKEIACQLTTTEKIICRTLGRSFRRENLFFVGIDLIGERLIEINITSPAGIPELNALYGGRFERSVIDAWVRKFCRGS